jgi:PHD/YefM family antitoxin component YafN of YafNO toxin-antitoxin module
MIMLTVHPQYITDTAGQQLVVLPVAEFNSIIEELEELEDIGSYDDARKNGTGERIPMDEAFRIIEANRGNF